MSYLTKAGEVVVYGSGMNRDTSRGKMRPDLIWVPGLIRYAELMARGAELHGERNWEKASTEEELNRFRESAFRHFLQWFNNETDEDHASAVKFNVDGAEMVRERLRAKGRARISEWKAQAASDVPPTEGTPTGLA